MWTKQDISRIGRATDIGRADAPLYDFFYYLLQEWGGWREEEMAFKAETNMSLKWRRPLQEDGPGSNLIELTHGYQDQCSFLW